METNLSGRHNTNMFCTLPECHLDCFPLPNLLLRFMFPVLCLLFFLLPVLCTLLALTLCFLLSTLSATVLPVSPQYALYNTQRLPMPLVVPMLQVSHPCARYRTYAQRGSIYNEKWQEKQTVGRETKVTWQVNGRTGKRNLVFLLKVFFPLNHAALSLHVL